jgi:hypothetical protein
MLKHGPFDNSKKATCQSLWRTLSLSIVPEEVEHPGTSLVSRNFVREPIRFPESLPELRIKAEMRGRCEVRFAETES